MIIKAKNTGCYECRKTKKEESMDYKEKEHFHGRLVKSVKYQACPGHKISFRFSNYRITDEYIRRKREIGFALRSE